MPGVTAVLHTWTRELLLHPHAHLLVTAGGLALTGDRWVSRKRFLFPIPMMQEVYRAKMLDALRRMRAKGVFDGFADFEDPEAFDRLLATVAKLDWVVYTKEPFHQPEHVLRYLGRYTHRVAISNSRLLDVTATEVTFRTRGADQLTLPVVEFLRRFLLHILPDGFHKIRHYGLYAGTNAETHWPVARDLLLPTVPADTAVAEDAEQVTWAERLLALTGRDVRRCRRCGGQVERLCTAAARSMGTTMPVPEIALAVVLRAGGERPSTVGLCLSALLHRRTLAASRALRGPVAPLPVRSASMKSA